MICLAWQQLLSKAKELYANRYPLSRKFCYVLTALNHIRITANIRPLLPLSNDLAIAPSPAAEAACLVEHNRPL